MLMQKRLHSVLRGGKVLSRIYKRFGTEYRIYVSQHSGLGDAFLTGIYIKGMKDDTGIIIVQGKGSSEVYKYCGLDRMILLSKEETDDLIHYCMFMDISTARVMILHYQALEYHFGIAWYLNGIKNLGFVDLMEKLLFSDMKHKERCIPTSRRLTINIADKSILLFPHSKTIQEIGTEFWQHLAVELRKWGYSIYSFYYGEETAIENTLPITCSIDQVVSLVEHFEAVIAARSGIVDIFGVARCTKIILYPTTFFPSYTGSRYIDFWSMKKYGFETIFDEIEVDSDIEQQNSIIKEIISIIENSHKSKVMK